MKTEMKINSYVRMLVALIAAVVTLHANGQAREYLPILEPGKSWVYEEIICDNRMVTEFKVLDKIMVHGRECYGIGVNDGDKAIYTLYEENGAIFWHNEGNDKFYRIMDLNIAPGEAFEWTIVEGASEFDDINFIYKVASLDLISLNETSRVRQQVEYLGTMVEGIGASRYIEVHHTDIPACSCDIYYTGRMLECRKDGEVIFRADDFHTLSNIDRSVDVRENPTIYDLSGRPVEEPQPGLIYIVGGKPVRRTLK